MADQPTASEQDEILTRLRRVEGQIRGIQRMIKEERECEAVATQLLAARAALDKVSLYIMSHHIQHCLASPDGETNQEQLNRVISFFLRFANPEAHALALEEGHSEEAPLQAGDRVEEES